MTELKFHNLHNRKYLQYGLALIFGFVFGFLLQKGRVCYYDVILGQLLLEDFTVLKVMLSAIVTGMIGIYAMKAAGWVKLHKKSGSLGTSLPGPLIFGVGFGILGYCPGTSVGAVAHGSLDALIGGVFGITVGAGLYAAVYPRLEKVLEIGSFGDRTLIDLFRARNPWLLIVPFAALIILGLILIEIMGL
ncbi:MAG: YeeE/YedE thiosulfate transporter family protein [Candidatus Erginobacter occultus]|nr:YeeE/YedE thiosulfate transporter family protein [Candidatus Erginobacter occultus]